MIRPQRTGDSQDLKRVSGCQSIRGDRRCRHEGLSKTGPGSDFGPESRWGSQTRRCCLGGEDRVSEEGCVDTHVLSDTKPKGYRQGDSARREYGPCRDTGRDEWGTPVLV